ncbi:hypothetical protein [Streptomyces chilikensis]|uniref:DUF3886 domain-containing protein n=1 Tax=Streptomyces chilikensis TaxID=1194079 RepID=A0ABV3EJD0_9ACTN
MGWLDRLNQRDRDLAARKGGESASEKAARLRQEREEKEAKARRERHHRKGVREAQAAADRWERKDRRRFGG